MRVIGLGKTLDFTVERLQMLRIRQGIANIIMSGIDTRFGRQGQETFDGSIKSPQITRKAITDGAVEKRVTEINADPV